MYKYNNINLFLFIVLLLITLLILSFCSYNIIIFYIFFEASLIPTIIIVIGWGYQPERVNARYYLLFYTLFASLPILVSTIYIITAPNVDYLGLYAVSYTHLDVYKRQPQLCRSDPALNFRSHIPVRDSVTHAPRVYAGRIQTSRKTEGLRMHV